VYVSESFERMTGREVWLKAENLQRTGSFKIRGAVNCIATLSADERAAGVVAVSAGNHAQAVAWAAREADIDATILRTGRIENTFGEITPLQLTTPTERSIRGRAGQGGATLSLTVGDGTLRIKPAAP